MTTTNSDDTSRNWAIAFTDLIDELGGDGPSLWKNGGEIPTPESIVNYLKEHIHYLQQCASDDELRACAELIEKRYSGCTDSGLSLSYHILEWLKNTRRPKPSPKTQALKDIEDMKKSCSVDPAILTNIDLDNLLKISKQKTISFHYLPVSSENLAYWLNETFPDKSWTVDGDETLSGLLDFPCDTSDLTQALNDLYGDVYIRVPKDVTEIDQLNIHRAIHICQNLNVVEIYLYRENQTPQDLFVISEDAF